MNKPRSGKLAQRTFRPTSGFLGGPAPGSRAFLESRRLLAGKATRVVSEEQAEAGIARLATDLLHDPEPEEGADDEQGA